VMVHRIFAPFFSTQFPVRAKSRVISPFQF
jgi:hypothetical protein